MDQERTISCPYCRNVVACFTWMGNGPPVLPPEGMPALCTRCLAIAVFAGQGFRLRRLRPADRAALADTQALAVLRAQLCELVRIRGRQPAADPWQDELTAALVAAFGTVQ